MNFSLFDTIKENWLEILIMIGMIYGVLFGVVLGLILFGTNESEQHLEIWYWISLTLVISGLVVLGICSAILVISIRDNESEAQQTFQKVEDK